MGGTLSTVSVWTSARDDGHMRLELTPINENVLNSIVKYVENFPGLYPELNKFVFQSPLKWISTVNPDQLGGGFTQQGSEWVSSTQASDGSPLCTFTKQGSDFEVSARSMEMCEAVLRAAGENKLSECRACLEANKDPLATMTGDRFAHVTGPDGSAMRYIDEIVKSKPGEGEETEGEEEHKQKMLKLQLLFNINDFDVKLTQECVKEISKEGKLSPSDVHRVVELLAAYCGDDEDRHVLESIAYHSDHSVVYKNGCRAPPMRQVRGEICYIDVRPHDTAAFCVTASTNGYFVNRMSGQTSGDEAFEKEGNFEKDLIVILRERSPKFNELIDQQEIFRRREDERRGILDTTEEGESQDYDKDLTHRSEKQKDQKDKALASQKKKASQRKKLEPSLKWKNLNIDEQKEREHEQGQRLRLVPRKAEARQSRQAAGWAADTEEVFVESESESEEEEDTIDRRNDTNTDLPSEYWQIQKLVKYLKIGNPTATVIALISMRDFNLQQETCQLAIRHVGGLEILINLLDTNDLRCKIGSLQILKEISKNPQIRRAIADLGGLQTMVNILKDPHKELKCLAAETIANVARFRRARRTVRQHGGITKLVALLDCKHISNATTAEMKRDVEVARCGALALWSCSKSTLNKQAMRKAGAIPLLAKLLKSSHEDMLIPVVGTLQECATEQSYRLAIRTEGMVEDLVKNLRSDNPELQMHCASAIFKSAEEKATRDLVRQYGGLDPLVTLLNNRDDKELLAAATGAIWKCSISEENVKRFKELKAIELLVGLLHDQPEEVLVNVVGGLAELAKEPANRTTIRKAGGLQPLVGLLTGTNQALLVNVTKAVGQCAEEADNMAVIDKLDGVRLLWSLLKNQNTQVQASAAWAICPCIENAKDAGEMVRSFVGGLELIVGLLESEDKEVLASVCAAIANIASDEENLAVITDHGVVPKLASLTNTNEDHLRRHLAEAIARCCNWGNNRVSFGKERAVAPLVNYLRSKDGEVHRSTAKALHQLSKDADNCITMHEAGVVKPLMEMVGSDDNTLQEAAAGCISNIRRLALANEKARK